MRKFSKQNYILILLLLLLVSACNSTKIITIEIPEAAQKELPQTIQSLVLVNRTVNEKYSDLDADSLQKIFYKRSFKLDTVIYDRTAVDTTLKALGELLYESGRYDFVIPEDRFLDFETNAFFSMEMPWPEVKELCDRYNTDAVLSIDMFRTKVTTKFDKDSYFDPMINGYQSVAAAEIKILYDVLFRIYDPIDEKIIVREFLKDTIQWSDVATTTNQLFARFTPIKKALSEAGIAVALDFSEKISTVWREEKRSFYVKGDENLKLAGTFIDNRQWQQTMALWKNTVEETKSKSTKSKAQLNVAIAYELQGDIENAILWALESYNTMYRQVTYQYLELLDRRKKELQK